MDGLLSQPNRAVVKAYVLAAERRAGRYPIPPATLAHATYAHQTRSMFRVDQVRQTGKRMRDLKRRFEGKLVRVTNIVPFLPITLCYHNCFYAVRVLAELNQTGWEIRFGFRLSACSCGKLIDFEPHFVLYHRPSNQYVEVTEDYDRAQFYYFVDVLPYRSSVSGVFASQALRWWFYLGNAHACQGGEWTPDCGERWKPIDTFDEQGYAELAEFDASLTEGDLYTV